MDMSLSLHVQMAESYSDQLNTWLTFVSISKMKSFVELIPAPSIRAGTQTLLAVCRINTSFHVLHTALKTIIIMLHVYVYMLGLGLELITCRTMSITPLDCWTG